MSTVTMKSPYKGSGQLTRQKFLFYEMRTTARLIQKGLNDEQVLNEIVYGNLYQYPTEKTIRQVAQGCVARLHALNCEDLIKSIAQNDSVTAKQICLYALMKQYRLVWDFMVTVIGEKYRTQNFSFSQMDVNVFLMQLQEQDDTVASWNESTVKKIRQVLIRVLVEADYLDSIKAKRINPVWLNPELEQAIKDNNDEKCLSAFNCFS